MDIKKDILFSFTTEDGTQKMCLADYEKNVELTNRFGRQATPPLGRQTLFMGKDIFSFDTQWLREHPNKYKAFESARLVYEANPLKYFVPQTNTVVDFLNWKSEDSSATMKVLHSSIGSGKSVTGCIDMLLDVVPCDKNWPIFTDFGVKYRTYQGPWKDGGVAIVSYELKNHENTLWPQVLKRWCPREYIEEYVSGKKSIGWRSSPKLVISDTPIFFLVSSQKDTAFVSQALNLIWWDEQSTEEKFNNANGRVMRRSGRHICTMTPHHIEGRADTGAGSYIDRIRKGEMNVGLDVKFFQMNCENVNDWVMRKGDKDRLKTEWIEDPIRTNNRKKLAEGRAIYYGEFHESSGLVLDEWDRSIHLIDPFEIPKHWTFYRYHDHGRKEPNAAILVAVSEKNEYFIFGEWYGMNKEIADNVKGIIEEMSQNEIVERDGQVSELMTSYDVVRTMSDPRSLSKELDNAYRTIQDEYYRCGLDLSHGSGQPPEKWVGLVASLLTPNMSVAHFSTGEMGAPKMYVFNNLTWLIKEIEGWKMKKTRVAGTGGMATKEKPEAKNDHLMTCLGLLAQDNPSYIPKKLLDNGIWEVDTTGMQKDRPRCPITGF